MKATKAEILIRIQEITKLLIEGYCRSYIIQYSSEKWGIGERMIDKYIEKSKKGIEETAIKNTNYNYSKAIRRFEHLLTLSINKRDFKTAVSITKEIASLQGLYKTQIEHSGNIQFISNIPD